MSKAINAAQRGLRCSGCGGTEFSIVYTRRAAGMKVIRRRECGRCHHRFTTWEMPILELSRLLPSEPAGRQRRLPAVLPVEHLSEFRTTEPEFIVNSRANAVDQE